MIARIWRGTASTANAAAYEEYFISRVVPHLSEIAGHCGASLLRSESDGSVEFTAITLWDSLGAIESFTGPDTRVAVVDPDARAVLETFETQAANCDLVFTNALGRSP